VEFIHYVPATHKREIPRELLYAFEGPAIYADVIQNGPDKGDGLLIAGGGYLQQTALVRMCHDRQQWRQRPASNLWIGWYVDHQPLPSDLVRKSVLDGKDVQLGDGKHWHVPIARVCHAMPSGQLIPFINLPRRMALDPATGKWIDGEVMSPYEPLFRVAQQWWDFLMDSFRRTDAQEGDTIELTKSEAADWCVTALQANYRVSAVEVWLLDLLNDLTRAEILNAVVDLETWWQRTSPSDSEEPEKKTEMISGSWSSPVGVPDLTPDITPLSRTLQPSD